MGSDITGALKAIVADCKAIALEAAKDAAHKGQKDVMDEENKYLQEYYSAYSPKMYQRKHALRRAMMPYWGDKSGTSSVSITIGITYNAGALKGAYRSNSAWHQSGSVWKTVPLNKRFNPYSKDFSSDYGIPDPNWILDNYLAGEHGGVYNDGQGTEEKMNKFFDNKLPNQVEEYFRTALFTAIASRL